MVHDKPTLVEAAKDLNIINNLDRLIKSFDNGEVVGIAWPGFDKYVPYFESGLPKELFKDAFTIIRTRLAGEFFNKYGIKV